MLIDKEIDYIEEYDVVLHPYEFKLTREAGRTSSAKRTFEAAYPGSVHGVINRDNFQQFLLP